MVNGYVSCFDRRSRRSGKSLARRRRIGHRIDTNCIGLLSLVGKSKIKNRLNESADFMEDKPMIHATSEQEIFLEKEEHYYYFPKFISLYFLKQSIAFS